MIESVLVAARGLRHHRAQTVVTIVVIAVLAAIAAAAPWYARMVRDQTTAAAFAVGEPGGTIRIDSSDERVPATHVPDDPRVIDPVRSREAALGWSGGTAGEPGEGLLLTRDDICDHLRIVDGTCPVGPGEIATSTADREAWGMDVGGEISFAEKAATAQGTFTIVGVYEVEDAADPYWYDQTPDGRSGYRDLEIPVADMFITQETTWSRFHELEGQSHLDLRIDGDQVRSDDLAALRAVYDELLAAVDEDPSSGVTSGLPAAIDRLDHGFTVAGRGIALTIGQLAAVGLVGLVLVAVLGVRARRRDLGLQRLRGRSPRKLAVGAGVEWFVLAVPSAVLGVLAAGGFAGVVRATWLDEGRVLWPPWAAILVAGVVPVLGSLLVGLLTWRAARQPIPALLRATEERAAAGRSGLLLLDVLLLAVVGCALLVALTSDESSPLVLLMPALLAMAGGVLISRLAVVLIGRFGLRWLVRRPASGLAALEIARGGGLRAVLIVSAVATALLVLTTQAALIGDHNRTHRAEVETGAAVVHSTTAGPGQVQHALDEIDPDRERATVVSTVGRTGDSYRILYVEPAAFASIALGADEARPSGDWSAIQAPGGEATPVTGTALRLRVDGPVQGHAPLQVWATVADLRGSASPLLLGNLAHGRAGEQVLTTDISCGHGCRLLSLSFVPTGEAEFLGTVTVETRDGGDWAAVPLDAAAWTPILPDDNRYRLAIESAEGGEGLRLDLATGGLAVDVQSAWLSTTLPVFLAERMQTSVDDGRAVRTPGGDTLPVAVRGRLADATPRALADVLVADLSVATRYGDTRADQGAETTIWFADDTDVAELRGDLAERGVRLVEVADVDDTVETYANTGEALAGQLNPIAAVLVALLAAGCLVLTVASGWRRRTADLLALDLAGVPRQVWARATRWSLLVPVVIGVVVGAVAGIAGTRFAVRRVPIFADEEPAIHLQLGLQTGAVVVAVATAAAVLLLVLLVAGRSMVRPGRAAR